MVVLASKVYVHGGARERALDSLESLVGNAIGDLDVQFEVGLRHDDFPTVTVEGPDAVVARNLLREEWGEIVPDPEPGTVATGTLESWDEDGFTLDAGDTVRIPATEIDLGGGSPSQIRKRFGLVQHLPIRYEAGDTPRIADVERDRLYDWQRAETGRVNVNSATRAEVRATVNRAGHAGDIITVERLGLLEQSIVCKPGTDPPGLLASIGSYLDSELLAVVP
ncbi:DUF2110 family protein [Halodesulfurarchaeum formicicum]|uniref:DUF2110 family protein n=1 Tax=Halodesulfurarchaeum formicicum TaxID=1873524 RepID=A0A1J1ACK0_9EURY|nr:DUF2110 family protein [Halodesulfurarchaeum formicicum]APE95613.1 hypothetical protein HSR6_1165 [Halodesulfurarchaeum formicicum]